MHKRNPVLKLLLVFIFTIIVCLSYFPALPILTFIIFFVATWLLGEIELKELIKRMLIFITFSVLFMTSMFVLCGLNDESDIVLKLGVFRWSHSDIVRVTSLGFRILALVTMSMSFVLTTKPSDLVLSLILQCRLSVVHGYATIATYRFLP